MPLTIDYFNKLIKITSPTTSVTGQELHDFIEDEGVKMDGVSQPDDWPTAMISGGIMHPEGKIDIDPENPGTKFSQIILIIHEDWQIQFWNGSGYTKIEGCTLVGGVGNKPVKAAGGATDITYFISPLDGIVQVSSGGITEGDKDDIADKVWDELASGHTTAGSFGKILSLINNAVKFLKVRV